MPLLGASAWSTRVAGCLSHVGSAALVLLLGVGLAAPACAQDNAAPAATTPTGAAPTGAAPAPGGAGTSPASAPAPAAPAPQPASAPVPQPATPPASGAKPASPKSPETAGTPATVIDNSQIESVLGKQVQSPKGEDMGHIVDILVDKTGDLRAAVVDFGGFFGVGSRKIAVEWQSLRFNSDGKNDMITVDLPRNQLRLAPVYKEGEPVVVLGRSSGDAKPPAEAAKPAEPPKPAEAAKPADAPKPAQPATTAPPKPADAAVPSAPAPDAKPSEPAPAAPAKPAGSDAAQPAAPAQ